MKKNAMPLEELDIAIEENSFESIKTNCLCLEYVYSGRLLIYGNSLAKCNSIPYKILGCRASKEDILFCKNSMASVYNIGLWIDSSVVKAINNVFSSCQAGIFLNLIVTVSSMNREDVFDSHKDIILRDTVKDIKDSFIGGTSNSHQPVGNNSFLGGNGLSGNYGSGGTGTGATGGTDIPGGGTYCRVILKSNEFKEIAHYGVLIQSNSSSSIKIESCRFRNCKEPIVIGERDFTMSRNNTRNFMQPDSSADLLAPSYNATPRQLVPSTGKGTIVLKYNSCEGTEACVVRKHVSSYLYDIDNVKL